MKHNEKNIFCGFYNGLIIDVFNVIYAISRRVKFVFEVKKKSRQATPTPFIA